MLPETKFRESLRELLNRNSMELGSDTPDFILAEYMSDCLLAFDKAVSQRAAFYGQETSGCESVSKDEQ